MRPRLILIAFLPAFAACSPSLAQTRVLEISSDRWIEVSGEGSVRATPDFARVTLGVTTTGKDAREAMAANAKSANALVAAHQGAGRLARRHPDFRRFDLADVFEPAARSSQRADDHRL